MWDAFFEYWWVWFWLLPMVFLYYRMTMQEKTMGLSLGEMKLVVTWGFILLLFYILQIWFFSDHIFFLLGLPYFLALFSVIIFIILQKDDMMVIESTMLGEEFFDLEDGKTFFATHTGHRPLIMDKETYYSKKHVGEADPKWWQGNDKIKFCDLYDDRKGVFHHPELPDLHNIGFYDAKPLFLFMKKELPKLRRQNIQLTWELDYRVAYEQETIEEAFWGSLHGIREQRAKRPYPLGNNIDDIRDYLKSEAEKRHRDEEEPEKPKQVVAEKVEASEGGD